MLGDCRRVALVNTGTSPEANASSAARLAEHLGLGPGDCIVYATTRESLAAARRARELLRETLDPRGAPRVLVDADALGGSTYQGLPRSPEEAVKALRELLHGLEGRLAAVDTTSRMRLRIAAPRGQPSRG